MSVVGSHSVSCSVEVNVTRYDKQAASKSTGPERTPEPLPRQHAHVRRLRNPCVFPVNQAHPRSTSERSERETRRVHVGVKNRAPHPHPPPLIRQVSGCWS